MYIRKTRDEYDIEVDYGYGWDVVCTEDTYKEAQERAWEYRENERKPVRIRKHRIKLETAKEDNT